MNSSNPVIDELENMHGSAFVDGLAEDISEASIDTSWSSHLEEGDDGYVFVNEIQKLDMMNVVISGAFWAGGVEYAFMAESGNNNGFVWRDVSAEGPVRDIEIERTTWALAPSASNVRLALETGHAPRLLATWDAFMKRPEVAEIPSKYAYDRYFQPGSVVESYWNDMALKLGLNLMSQQESDEVRETLTRADRTNLLVS